jgi:hypothetical protein
MRDVGQNSIGGQTPAFWHGKYSLTKLHDEKWSTVSRWMQIPLKLHRSVTVSKTFAVRNEATVQKHSG